MLLKYNFQFFPPSLLVLYWWQLVGKTLIKFNESQCARSAISNAPISTEKKSYSNDNNCTFEFTMGASSHFRCTTFNWKSQYITLSIWFTLYWGSQVSDTGNVQGGYNNSRWICNQWMLESWFCTHLQSRSTLIVNRKLSGLLWAVKNFLRKIEKCLYTVHLASGVFTMVDLYRQLVPAYSWDLWDILSSERRGPGAGFSQLDLILMRRNVVFAGDRPGGAKCPSCFFSWRSFLSNQVFWSHPH